MPLLRVHRSARSTETSRESVLVRVQHASGDCGLAECPTLSEPGYVTETTEQAWTALRTELVPRALRGEPCSAPSAPAASAALADALLDARLRAAGVSLSSWLAGGGNTRRSVPWCAVLTDVAAGVGQVLREAERALDAGAAMLKVKFADPDALTESVVALTARFDVPVAADANGSLDPASAAGLDGLGLVYVEQPLPHAVALDDLAALCGQMVTPVCLDESLDSVGALTRALQAGALDVASLKPARLGGVEAAAGAAALCGDAGVQCFVGGMFELGVGRAAALALASLPGCTLPTDLGPSGRYFVRDVCEPLRTDALGCVQVPRGAGVGRDLDDEVVAAHLVERVVLEA